MTLLETLKVLHVKMQDPANWDMFGICSNTRGFDVSPLMAEWPLYSGNRQYPVGQYDHPCFLYTTANSADMWDRENSPYAELRWQLLEFMICMLEKDEQMPKVAHTRIIADGWTAHTSGHQPAADDAYVHFMTVREYGDAPDTATILRACDVDWSIEGGGGDVYQWRLADV